MTLPVIWMLPETYRQTLGYRTDVIRGYNGYEWRQALLGSPRESWDLTYLLSDADVLTVRAALAGGLAGGLLVPAHERPLAATAAITSTTITVNVTNSDWPVIGDQVIVMNALDQYYTAGVTNVVGGTVTVDTSPPGGQTYPAGTIIRVLRTVLPHDGQNLAHYPVHEGTWALSGIVSTYESTVGTGATLTTFDSLPVVDHGLEMDAASTLPEQVAADLELLDRGAKIESRTALAFGNLRRPFTIFINGDSDRQWVRLFAQTMLGQQGLFLLPTWKPDLSVHTQPSVGATSLLVDSTPNYLVNWFPSLAHRHLQLQHADGSVEYAKVTAVVDNGNGTQTLTVVGQTAGGLSGTAITMASLLEQCRLDSDDIPITWSTTSGHAELVGLAVPQ